MKNTIKSTYIVKQYRTHLYRFESESGNEDHDRGERGHKQGGGARRNRGLPGEKDDARRNSTGNGVGNNRVYTVGVRVKGLLADFNQLGTALCGAVNVIN